MFKKPLSDTKTSAPLRGSERRKLRQRAQQAYAIDQEELPLLVPEGLLVMKFSTHHKEPGLLYLSAEGDPLWFSIGKNANDSELIPTVYTLWKRPMLLPCLTTPSPVIPVLIGGADLMVPGVVQCVGKPNPGTLVCVSQYERGFMGPGLAVGRMAVDPTKLLSGQIDKGKAVVILHTWKDSLWELGSKADPPPPEPFGAVPKKDEETGITGSNGSAPTTQPGGQSGGGVETGEPAQGGRQAEASVSDPSKASVEPEEDKGESSGEEEKLTPEEVSTVLRTSLLQALKTTLASLPTSAFPMQATTFYTSHILPARPASRTGSISIDIKHSAFKSLTAFLKQSEKQGLIKLKDSKPDVAISAVFPTHADVAAHALHLTVGEIDDKKRKEKERADRREQAEEARERSLSVVELWKPHQTSVKLFQDVQMDTSALYTGSEVRAALNNYVATHDLINHTDQRLINVASDDILNAATSNKSKPPLVSATREELTVALCDRMQPWHRVRMGKSDPVTKKGQLRPISVVVKIRQGRKACTLITGFESFLLSPTTIADALRARCASSTAVSPLPGRGGGEEIMVQGKQLKTVTDFLTGELGVPKKWIEVADLSDAKKKK
ncbi:hypothetical protein EVG20_g5538 [Dentipellis fragilis]|uniref:Uncharacterized protein n=1 Tax=Dentipellis fragilis TaxID=205917 RepID=A0A4Y9YV15_9AGAM|nr:hypothetical protein EVG20_g5538 [Dentipellis fragilis]